ncbi:MAG TPA: twin-arginine translocase TatA/TatE family subunit [Blastocatellia bacterium]|nr:twin-arginine translocase TatA/TatE family subunit [Blastocatellia bacterium]
MTEILIVMVIALIVFGPRKLPDLGKSLGQALAQFRRASDDFKRTWEQEVEIEKTRRYETTTSAETSYHADNSSYSDHPDHYQAWHETGATDATTEAHHEQAGASEQPSKTPDPVVASTAGTQAGQKPGANHWI